MFREFLEWVSKPFITITHPEATPGTFEAQIEPGMSERDWSKLVSPLRRGRPSTGEPPHEAGIYRCISRRSGLITYIGYTADLAERQRQHMERVNGQPAKYYAEVHRFEWQLTKVLFPTDLEAKLKKWEDHQIQKYKARGQAKRNDPSRGSRGRPWGVKPLNLGLLKYNMKTGVDAPTIKPGQSKSEWVATSHDKWKAWLLGRGSP